jgi:hypothetical protein
MKKLIRLTATVISFYALFSAASNVHSKEYTTDVEKTVAKINCLGGQVETSGTGFVFDITQKNAFVLTANHVVTDEDGFQCENIQVEFTGHLDTYKATIYRNFDQFDIAILRLKQFPGSTGILKLGNSQDVDEGSIFIYGYPGGADGHKDYGSISNKSANKIILDDITPAEGNSGGPLFYENTNDVIGVIIQKSRNKEDQYALEIDQVKLLLKNIKIFANLFPAGDGQNAIEITKRALAKPKENAWYGDFEIYDPKTFKSLAKGKLRFGPTTYKDRIAYARIAFEQSSITGFSGDVTATASGWGFMGVSTDSSISLVFAKNYNQPVIVFNKLTKDFDYGYLELRGVLMMKQQGENKTVAHTKASCRAR